MFNTILPFHIPFNLCCVSIFGPHTSTILSFQFSATKKRDSCGPETNYGQKYPWISLYFIFLQFVKARGTKMLRSILACGKVYISETRNRVALELIDRAAKQSTGAAIVNKFEDEIYNRVGYTVVSKLSENTVPGSCPLKEAVLAMVKAAFETIDLELHSGSHPRLGVVDHICFHPLGQTSLEQIVGIAKSLAADIGSDLHGSCFLLGHNDKI